MLKVFNKNNIEKELLFIPLGGAGEIGMNCNLYHYNNKWIMVDMGINFYKNKLNEMNIMIPCVQFIKNQLNNKIIALIITHAHEDHIGAIIYLYKNINCRIYATKMTKNIIQSKMKEYNICYNLNIVEVKKKFKIEDFFLEYLNLPHSIPEMNAIIISTPIGNVFHTGDWRFNSYPLLNYKNNLKYFFKISKKNILAIVGDSTNIFNKIPERSESILKKNLIKIINKYNKNLIIITTFASNIIRLKSIILAANISERKVILIGKSLKKMFFIAQKSGFLLNQIIYEEKELNNFVRNKILIICTGCQGEKNSVIYKIASNNFNNLIIKNNDLIIFSSKIIPGNEKEIYNIFNKLVFLGAKVLNENNFFTHVSGHSSCFEIDLIYRIINPLISIPIHGENFHLQEHYNIAKNLGIPYVIKAKNGDIIIIKKNYANILSSIKTLKYVIDKNMIIENNNILTKTRTYIYKNGILFIILILDKYKIISLNICAPGILDVNLDYIIINNIKNKILYLTKYINIYSFNYYTNSIIKLIKKFIQLQKKKTPLIELLIKLY